jgi:hypothetical protein
MGDNTPESSYATPPEKSDYDFIMKDKPKGRPNLLPVTPGSSLRNRILVVVAAGVLLIALIAILASFFIRDSKSTITEMTEIAKQQQELIRVATLGTQNARTANGMNLAVTAKSTLESDQKATVAYLTSQKQKIDQKTLALGKNSQTDSLLTLAEQTNKFDETFTEIMRSELTKYQAQIKKTHDSATSKKAKQVLADNYAHVGALLEKK